MCNSLNILVSVPLVLCGRSPSFVITPKGRKSLVHLSRARYPQNARRGDRAGFSPHYVITSLLILLVLGFLVLICSVCSCINFDSLSLSFQGINSQFFSHPPTQVYILVLGYNLGSNRLCRLNYAQNY